MVYVLLGTGFEELEALSPVDLLRRANIPVTTVGINGKTVYGSHHIGITADVTIEEATWEDLEMLVIPGGLGGVASIKACKKAMDAITNAYEGGKYVAAICAGPTILAQLHITDEKQAVCYPGCEDQMGAANMLGDKPCIRDGNVITGASAGCAIPFALALIEALQGPEAAAHIASQIVIR